MIFITKQDLISQLELYQDLDVLYYDYKTEKFELLTEQKYIEITNQTVAKAKELTKFYGSDEIDPSKL